MQKRARQKRTDAEIAAAKKKDIEEMFRKIQPIIRNKKKIEELREDSSLRKMCNAARMYLFSKNHFDGCKQIYDHFRVRPYGKYKDLAELVKKKLRALQSPGVTQTELFALSA